MSLLEGTVGPATLGDGADSEIRLGRTKEIITGNAHGRYHESTARGNVYHAAMQASAALGTALTATAATLTLYNPVGSGVVLSVLNVSCAFTAAPTGTSALVYAINVPASTVGLSGTAATVRCSRLSASSGRGQAFTACTLPAVPVIARALGTAGASIAPMDDDVCGALVLPEGTALTIQNIGATAPTGIVAISWEETPG